MSRDDRRNRGWGWRHLVFALYALLCASMLVWPGFAAYGNRVEPFVMGMPFALFWNVLWVVVTFLFLIAYHMLTETER